MSDELALEVLVNGVAYRGRCEARVTLADFLRGLGLSSVRLGCEHGVCGACTILMNGVAVRSCLMFAVQADGTEITTAEGIGQAGQLTPLQDAMVGSHAFQCGYCTPGILMTLTEFLSDNPQPSREEVQRTLSGNLCRCTGYQPILDAVLSVTDRYSAGTPTRPDDNGDQRSKSPR